MVKSREEQVGSATTTPESQPPHTPVTPQQSQTHRVKKASISSATSSRTSKKDTAVKESADIVPVGAISRAISACSRCRSRKTKCDQLFPACTACKKAGVECLGVDAATGKQVARSYVTQLEVRIKELEAQLENLASSDHEHNIHQRGTTRKRKADVVDNLEATPDSHLSEQQGVLANIDPELRQEMCSTAKEEKGKDSTIRPSVQNLVSAVTLTDQPTQSLLGGRNGISFAKLMFAAVKVSSKELPARIAAFRGRLPEPWANKTTSLDSEEMEGHPVSAALQTIKPPPPPAPFPDYPTAKVWADIYFEEANPQIPILFRPIFDEKMEAIYTWLHDNPGSGIEDLPEPFAPMMYCLNMVFAIASAMNTRFKSAPEAYHTAAMPYMTSVFSTPNKTNGLKGVLLLALYSMMRPAVPGVWYVIGTALRMCVDLGLHQETPQAALNMSSLALDERRRLFWSAYSLDRHVGVFLGRPFGIPDDCIKVPWPLDVDDKYLSGDVGLKQYPDTAKKSSKTIARHMFRIRQLQSEIYTILHQQSEIPRKFKDLVEWRKDMENRLTEWTISVPKSRSETNCGYNLLFIDLNYQQSLLLLFGLSPAVPIPDLEGYIIMADAGNRIIKSYRQLHRSKGINYTWLACHNLFMAATSYLCAIWHCPEVRKNTTIDEIDFNTLAVVDIMNSMQERCPAAVGCRDVFSNLASATVQICNGSARESETRSLGREKRLKSNVSSSNEPNSRHGQAQFEPVSHALPASLANIVHHVPVSSTTSTTLPGSSSSSITQTDLSYLTSQPRSEPPYIASPTDMALHIRPHAVPPTSAPVEYPPPQSSPMNPYSPHNFPDTASQPQNLSQQQSLIPDYNHFNHVNADQVMRAAIDLNDDETYNLFSSAHANDPDILNNESIGGQVFQLMSDVGGGSIWDNEFLFDTRNGDNNTTDNDDAGGMLSMRSDGMGLGMNIGIGGGGIGIGVGLGAQFTSYNGFSGVF